MKRLRILSALIFCALASLPGLQAPARAQAVGQILARPFDTPLTLPQGTLSPLRPGAEYYTPDDACRILRDWGWSDCDGVSAMVSERAAGIATMVIEKPDTNGHVIFDDWKDRARRIEIAAIWDGFVADLHRQAKETGSLITPTGWAVQPTLDRNHNLLYYAMSMDWDGHRLINARAAVFDRTGYVALRIVPVDGNISKKELKALVEAASASYRPAEGSAYDDFENGDRISPDGALGTLAAMVDVPLPRHNSRIAHRIEIALRRGWLPLVLILLAAMIYFAAGRAKTD